MATNENGKKNVQKYVFDRQTDRQERERENMKRFIVAISSVRYISGTISMRVCVRISFEICFFDDLVILCHDQLIGTYVRGDTTVLYYRNWYPVSM